MNGQYIPQLAVPDEQDRVFSFSETFFAWFCLLAGYLFCRSFPVFTKPFGSFLYVISVFTVTVFVLAINKARFNPVSVLSAMTGILFAFSLIMTSNGTIQFFAYVCCIVSYIFFIYTSYGNQTEKRFSDRLVLDLLKAAFAAPCLSVSKIGKALLANGKINARPLLKVAAGICAAVIPTAAVVLLLSYDSSFSALLDRIFNFDVYDIFSHVFSFIIGIPIGTYIFGLMISSADGKCKDLITESECRSFIRTVKFVPKVTVVFSVLPLLAVYVIFFISQWKYYVSAFTGELPEGLSYSVYAREGFFQLCAVSVINFLIITSISLFMKRNNQYSSKTESVISCVLSLFTLILITTALSKMMLYIDIYGLTRKRVYASWFMIVLALVFIIVMIKQFAKKLPVVLLSLLLACAMFGVLAFGNTDGFIAEYNLDRYIEGKLERYDVHAMSELGDAAIPSLVRLIKHMDEKNGTDFQELLNKNVMRPNYELSGYSDEYLTLCRTVLNMRDSRSNSFWSLTVPQKRADQALSSLRLDQ